MALYAYAVVEATAATAVELGSVDVGGLRAVVREVDVEDYESPRLEEHLRDPAWLEAEVRGHEQVVEGLLAAGSVVPMQFGSIFSTAEALRSMLQANTDELERLLDRVRDRQEWGVKLRVDLAASARDLVPTPAPQGGRAYLERRRDEQRAGERAAEQAAAIADEVHQRLGALAAGAATLGARPTSDPTTVLLNGAYLVPTSDLDAFLAGAEDVRGELDPAYRLDVSGPWPPYSFTTVDVAGPR